MRRKIASARIDMRTTAQNKYFLELAAFIGGYDSLSDFMVKASESKAKEVFDAVDDSRELSAKDRDLLLHFLENSPEPNEKLKAAYQKVLAMYQIDENNQAVYNIPSYLLKNQDNVKTQGRTK